MAKPIRALELHYPVIQFLTIEINAEQLHSGTEISLESLFLCVSRSPIRCGFHAGAKAIWNSMNTDLICDSPTLGIGVAQLCSIKEFAPKSLFLCVNSSPIQ